MKTIKAIGVWFMTVIILIIAGGSIFPPDSTGTVNIPAWYVNVILFLPLVAVLVYLATRSQSWFGSKDAKKSFSPYQGTSLHPKLQGDLHSVAETAPKTLVDEAAFICFETGMASVSMLQRRLKIGYSSAARLMDTLERHGVVSPFDSKHPRLVLMTKEEYCKLFPDGAPYIEFEPKDPEAPTPIPINDIIQAEKDWRREQSGLRPIEYELSIADSLDGHAFEEWCADLLRKNGFINVEVTKGSGDQGVDVLATKGGIKYAIQCKCYTSDLGNTPVQEVHAGKAFYICHVGVVMTNRHFTSGARELAEKTGVLLWDREKLVEMIELEKKEA